MKKIAILSSNICTFGGTERVTANLANSLSKCFDVHIITLFQTSNIVYALNKNIKIYNLYTKKKRLRSYCYDSIFKIRRYMIRNNIEVVLVIGRTVEIVSILSFLFSKIKIIFCEHNTIMFQDKSNRSLKQVLHGYIFQILINNFTTKIILLNAKELSNYFNKFRITKSKLGFIYNFIDLNNYLNLDNYKVDSMKIITVGRIDYAKGYEYLIETAKLVFAKHPDWQWHIYGDGETEYKKKIIELIKQNNLENNIILQGNRSDIYDLYQEYSFLAMTSRYEGLPMVLLEAKAKKLPIVSFDINSGPSDIIQDGIDGFLIKPFDCNAMADKICELIENPQLRQKFSDNAHGNIDKFSKDKIIRQWCELIEEISSQ